MEITKLIFEAGIDVNSRLWAAKRIILKLQINAEDLALNGWQIRRQAIKLPNVPQ